MVDPVASPSSRGTCEHIPGSVRVGEVSKNEVVPARLTFNPTLMCAHEPSCSTPEDCHRYVDENDPLLIPLVPSARVEVRENPGIVWNVDAALVVDVGLPGWIVDAVVGLTVTRVTLRAASTSLSPTLPSTLLSFGVRTHPGRLRILTHDQSSLGSC